ncbi:unnamed protein product [Diamesa tonsa]
MNIKVTLLTAFLCFTLEMTKISGMMLEAEVLGAVSNIDTIMTVQRLLKNKNQEVFYLLQRLQKDSEKLSLGMSIHVHDVDERTKTLIKDMLSTSEMAIVNDIINEMTTLTLLLGRNLNKNVADSKLMIDYLKNAIQTFELESHESSLLEYLDSPVVNTTTITNLLIERLQQSQHENSSKMRTSTNKLIHEFFTWVMMAVGMGQSFLELCYNLKPYTEDLKFLASRRKLINDKLVRSWKKAMAMTHNRTDLISYYDLSNEVKYIRFKSALQTHLVSEQVMNNNCQGTCSDVKKLDLYVDEKCKGYVYYCKNVMDRSTNQNTASKIHSKDPTRMWDQYMMGGKTYGLQVASSNYPFGKQENMVDSVDKHRDLCENCRCTCDQEWNPDTVRSFYYGKMEPEENGTVITGVRFAEHDSIVYIEIEVGQLLPIGMVDPESVRWQGPPKDIEGNYVGYGYVFRGFHLDSVFVKHGFVTGLQLFQNKNSLRLRVFSRWFKSFADGTISEREDTNYDDDNDNTVFFIQDKIPLIATRPGPINLNWNYNILFGTSNQKSDAGQSMVPYFDSTDITFDVKAPLGGIGFLHHTSSVEYAGFIRPYILNLNYDLVAVDVA